MKAIETKKSAALLDVFRILKTGTVYEGEYKHPW